ncbi:MAG: hypothetical protein HRT47_13230 [Candidatus Caenarcaniphilales bacterium]|nr:hypothetical protein [Candidatus Caenarcaniphilales bacterium]
MQFEQILMNITTGIVVTAIILSCPVMLMYDHYKWKKRNGRLNPNKSFLQNFWGA